MTTPNLAIPHLAASQNQKEATINDAFDRLDDAVNAVTAVAVTGTLTLTAEQLSGGGVVRLTGTPGSAFTVNLPATSRLFAVQNLTDAAATVQVTGGAGDSVEVAAGAASILLSDGADIALAAGGATGPAGPEGPQGPAGTGSTSNWSTPFRGARAKFDADKTGLNLSVGVILSWDSVDGDTDGFWDAGAPTLFTVPAGITKVRLHASVRMTTGSAGGAQALYIHKNGSALFPGSGSISYPSAFSTLDTATTTAVVDVEEGDEFRVFYFVSSQTNETLAANNTFFSIEVVETADAVAPPEDVAGFLAGVPGSSALLLRRPVARALDFPAGLTGSQGAASVAATAQADFDLRKNGVSFGTMRFAAAADEATFIAASATSFAAGDVISVHAPASADATLADVGFALAGARAI